MTSIELLDAPAAEPYADRMFDLYDEVIGRIPDKTNWRTQLFDRDRARPGFRLALALDGERVVGFAWGYRGDRGQAWPDLVARTLPELPGEWLRDHFELVELVVDPDYRRQGIGGGLHDTLLEGLTGRALLGTTLAASDPALCLYQARGWSTLGHLHNNRQVMGAYLPLP
ncbi:GNAT family N-acetyltransferase [Flexivirga caeni]|uniref:GNAT family N-acetyltransferase n=1 Tax=Flexivirga caeni TaxID=2294115 RepID=A0A3M9MEI0_9MICO|nr:GNAT family N-acetyltransferase [Flexivirga caeni]RNI23243.1 GNAT family N-acetyltransferase [Flexivirga caeni]